MIINYFDILNTTIFTRVKIYKPGYIIYTIGSNIICITKKLNII